MRKTPWLVKTGLWAAAFTCLLLLDTSGLAAADPPPPAPMAAKRFQPLPGADEYSAPLQEQLRGMYQQRGSSYVPRTRHLHADGSAKYTNRLFLQSSPYLLQHAHNPVNWYPWGDEAFALARQLNRPVLLSVGYSTCHWCHVMEEESFEDEEIARFLNEHYVIIKVDREERPDVDAIYMSAVQALTGRGGWPMTVWLTPQRKPFYGGTYFPARDGERGARYGFLSLLTRLEEVYRQQPDKVAQSSEQLTQAIGQRLAPQPGGDLPSAALLDSTVTRYRERFDSRFGGLDGAPKFPSSLPIRLLLRQYRSSGDAALLNMVTSTLKNMAAGGMHDQVGGGFHRYSTDQRWLVPHFEKMLYDNALLAVVYLEAWQVTGDAAFQQVAEDILRYVQRDMTSGEGGFYSATDADSPTPDGRREEGWFFTWTPAEIDQVLDPQAAGLAKAYYQVTAAGNFEGRSILHTPQPLDSIAHGLELTGPAAQKLLGSIRDTLYQARQQRPPPSRDEKILTAWNGLMISAYARAGLVLDRPGYTNIASVAGNFVLDRLYRDGRLYRSYKDGQARHMAYLDDYAFLTAGLLDLYEASSDIRWLQQAISLDKTLERHYEDHPAGGFFMTADDHETLLTREKPAYDGAEPSGNSVALLNLLRLHEFTTDDHYRQRADKALQAFAGTLQANPFALTEMLLALSFRLDQAKEIIIVTPPGEKPGADPATSRMLAALRQTFVPNRVIVVVEQGKALERQASVIPLLRYKQALHGQTTAYVCQQGICELPTQDPAEFARQLAQTVPLTIPAN